MVKTIDHAQEVIQENLEQMFSVVNDPLGYSNYVEGIRMEIVMNHEGSVSESNRLRSILDLQDHEPVPGYRSEVYVLGLDSKVSKLYCAESSLSNRTPSEVYSLPIDDIHSFTLLKK